MHDSLAACDGATLIVFTLFALEGAAIAEYYGIPGIAASPFVPATPPPTRFHAALRAAHPQMYAALCAAKDVERGALSMPCVDFWMWRLFLDDHGTFRTSIGLPAVAGIPDRAEHERAGGDERVSSADPDPAESIEHAGVADGRGTDVPSRTLPKRRRDVDGGDEGEDGCETPCEAAEDAPAPGPQAIPLLVGASATLVERDATWPCSARLCGVWPSAALAAERVPDDVAQWLEGEDVMLVTFGSMETLGVLTVHASAIARAVHGCVRRRGWRAVVQCQHGGALWRALVAGGPIAEAATQLDSALLLSATEAMPGSDACDAVPSCPARVLATAARLPHDAVMPRCRVVLHHGGAGTTAACVRAGRPQAAWAETVVWRELGSRVTADGLSAAALDAALDVALCATVRAAVDLAGRAMQAEHGLGEAVRVVLSFLPEPTLVDLPN